MYLDRSKLARVAAVSVSLSLAVVLSAASLAQAAQARLAYSLVDDMLKASVTGSARTGVWRVRVVAPGAERRIDFILRTGDISWSGVARVSRRDGGSWSIVGRRVLDGALAGGQQISGCSVGVCWSTANFRLPRNGDARFGVKVELTRSGTYRIAGALRDASEAFVFGPWLSSGSASVDH
ncbi:MAG: hypothetical protein M3N29_05120 [Chloroflexota bacterium]|nr:hypothetical protein [Chloroflexota bacterium]